ncbi:hypothetical protein [Alkalibacillus haloalkaliphilus]|uniref:hypothetical protein n=1 Tax=Alkalibacillus haloalkaliphilus TaxID=94136 RepID=UPI002935BCE6|nr:hypothetical protein [Alkalibacillus haloalkaliphilus]MDV2582792.1 hypothetical protein [Alkalibacillus haloalkaliphilus]
MFKRLYSRLILILIRLSLYLLFKHKASKLKKTKSYEDVNSLMKNLLNSLVRSKNLNDDITVGPEIVNSKSGRKLVSVFVANRNKSNEDDFYVQVAKEWIEGYEKKFHRISIIFIILFILLWFSGIFLNQYISNVYGLIFVLGLFLFPVFGFVFAGLGKGGEKWLLIVVNVLCFMVFVSIIL